MRMKGQFLEIATSWWGIFILALIVLGLLIAIFGYNLIPGAKEWLMRILGIGT
jgi:hypothetical protein